MTARSRRKIILDATAQYQFVGLQLIPIVLVLGLFGLSVRATTNELETSVRALASAPEIGLRALVDTQARDFYTGSLVLAAATLVWLVACGLIASQRLLGPLHKLKGHFEQVERGEAATLAFRRKDGLESFAGMINTAVATMRTRRENLIQALEATERLAQKYADADTEQREENLREMTELVAQMRAQSEAEG